MENYFNEYLTSSCSVGYLTGLITGIVKYNDRVDNRTKVFLLNNLIECHQKNSTSMSKKVIDESNELLKTLTK